MIKSNSVEKSTQEKIIDTAIHLYNLNGISNTSMRDISDTIGISVGNVSYHFKSKEELILYIGNAISEDLAKNLTHINAIPSLENLYKDWIPFLSMYSKYRFLVVDQVELVRMFPSLKERIQSSIEKQIEYLNAILSYLVGSGVVKTKSPIIIKHLAENIWLYLNYWMTQNFVRGKEPNIRNFISESRISLSIMILPYLTEKGVEEQRKLRYILENAETKLDEWMV